MILVNVHLSVLYMLISDDVVEYVSVYGGSLTLEHATFSDKMLQISPGGRTFL